MRNLFGTDGIRGIANKYPMTTDTCFNLAKALTTKFSNTNSLVIIGKDTRISGSMFEHAFASAFSSLGINVKLIGICPTPAISILTKSMQADFGIMISASHNPFADNGIKIFNNLGLKLTDQDEEQIENIMSQQNICDECNEYSEIIGEKIGSIEYSSENLQLYYIDKIKNSFSFDQTDTSKIKIALDLSNGSFSKIAPQLFRYFGFDIISQYESPNGININEKCGVTNPQTISDMTLTNNADLGIAFDGDGDRLLMCDTHGRFLDGDHILAILAESSDLLPTEIVSTIMSNFGFEQYLKKKNIKLIRTQVGDRYISEYMLRSDSAFFGGEPSGHIIIKQHAPTGDGLFAALSVLNYLIKSGKKISDLYNIFKPYPVVSRNIKVSDKNILSKISSQINFYKNMLLNRGKLIVRASGTEPLIRISAEGEDQSELESIVSDIAKIIQEAQ
ncbi:MAG: phosphoglucosamine mutase [Alphaproteobacteria bacterium]|nr:phosphoglucosamine mutase [Alphaproteobacteria bacterium]